MEGLNDNNQSNRDKLLFEIIKHLENLSVDEAELILYKAFLILKITESPIDIERIMEVWFSEISCNISSKCDHNQD